VNRSFEGLCGGGTIPQAGPGLPLEQRREQVGDNRLLAEFSAANRESWRSLPSPLSPDGCDPKHRSFALLSLDPSGGMRSDQLEVVLEAKP